MAQLSSEFFAVGDPLDDEVIKWIENHTGIKLIGSYSAIVYYKDGIQGAAVFNEYTGSNINIHVFGPNCWTKRTLKEIYAYTFIQLRCNRVTALIKSSDFLTVDFAERSNFIYEATLKDYFSKDVDALVYKLTKENANKHRLILNERSKAAASSRP